ncbi:hypothetical protein J3D48_006171 [Pseudomonas fluorescens]|nr:hypothetical protein [Pseudomonas fluorescens]
MGQAARVGVGNKAVSRLSGPVPVKPVFIERVANNKRSSTPCQHQRRLSLTLKLSINHLIEELKLCPTTHRCERVLQPY